MYDMLNLPLVFVGVIVAYRITIISSVLQCVAYLAAWNVKSTALIPSSPAGPSRWLLQSANTVRSHDATGCPFREMFT